MNSLRTFALIYWPLVEAAAFVLIVGMVTFLGG